MAAEPERWLRNALRREAAAMGLHDQTPGPMSSAPEAMAVGQRTLVEVEIEGRDDRPIAEVGKRTLVEEEIEGRGWPYPADVGKQTLVQQSARRNRRAHAGLLSEVEAVLRTLSPEPAESPTPAEDNAELPDEIRADLEAATGQSLSHVTVHAGERGQAVAASHGARAVAIDSAIHVAKGELDATSPEGRELFAHEVAHTVQADAKPGSPATPSHHSAVIETAEAEADQFAAQFRVEGAAARFTPKVAVAGVAMRAPDRGAAPRQAAQPAPEAQRDGLGMYLQMHSAEVQNRFRAQLEETAWPDVGPDAPFTPRGRRMFASIVANGFAPRLFDGGAAVEQLLRPSDLRDSYQRLVGNSTERLWTRGSADFNAAFASVVANAVRRSLVERVGPLYCEVRKAHPEPPAAKDLLVGLPSEPISIDPIVIRALTEPGVVATSHGAKAPEGKPAPHAGDASSRAAVEHSESPRTERANDAAALQQHATETLPHGDVAIAPPEPGIFQHGFIDNSKGATMYSSPAPVGGAAVRGEPLPPASRLYVSGTHSRLKDWWYVTAYIEQTMVRGYVEAFRVNVDLPEPSPSCANSAAARPPSNSRRRNSATPWKMATTFASTRTCCSTSTEADRASAAHTKIRAFSAAAPTTSRCTRATASGSSARSLPKRSRAWSRRARSPAVRSPKRSALAGTCKTSSTALRNRVTASTKSVGRSPPRSEIICRRSSASLSGF